MCVIFKSMRTCNMVFLRACRQILILELIINFDSWTYHQFWFLNLSSILILELIINFDSWTYHQFWLLGFGMRPCNTTYHNPIECCSFSMAVESFDYVSSNTYCIHWAMALISTLQLLKHLWHLWGILFAICINLRMFMQLSNKAKIGAT
jgi:hypothetical protein